MNAAIRKVARLCLTVSVIPAVSMAAENRPVTVHECACLRRVIEVKISRTGDKVAYIVKAPDATTNKNNFEVWVRGLKDGSAPSNGHLILQGTDEAAGLTWMTDDRRIALLTRDEGKSKIIFVDVQTDAREVVLESTERIDANRFCVSASGNAVAYAIQVSNPTSRAEESTDRNRALYGYSIPFGYPPTKFHKEYGRIFGTKEIHILRKTSAGKWTSESDRELAGRSFNSCGSLNLSPDGNYLAFIYQLDVTEVPAGWRENRYVRLMWDQNTNTPDVLALYDLKTGQIRLPFDSPLVRSRIQWSDDSRGLVVAGVPPIDTFWDKKYSTEDMRPLSHHVFTIDVPTSDVYEVSPPAASDKDSQVFWNRELVGAIVSWKQSHGDILAQRDGHTYAYMKLHGNEWVEANHFAVQVESQGGEGAASSVANEDVLVGVQESSMTPPDLFAFDFVTQKRRLLTDLNPEMRQVALGAVNEIKWKNRYGSEMEGFLIKPVGYEPGKRYPLVVMDYGRDSGFLCGNGGNTPSPFPLQPLAGAGFLVLYTGQPHGKVPERYDRTPILWEMDEWVAVVESAVDFLADQGIADRKNVGLIGWSRSSAKTDFLLTHSNLKLAAASSADSGAFNYGSFWFWQGAIGEIESLYGGPPYGPSLQNWLKYAPPFNADKVQTPLLMEYMGERFFSEPYFAYEFFTALHLQGKPVELFFYPNGDHALDTPFERVASMQRNVDWFRFWMQDYEGKAPDYDPDQYIRWRKLRAQQKWNDVLRAKGRDPSAEFLRQVTPGAVVNDTDRAPAAKEFLH
jgi:dipeptidyl aminopeptidase/acylaminoacyl peptidase